MSPDVLPPYAELHCRSNFSFLSGASHPEELVERAQALGYAALAVTDACSLAGIVRAHVAAKDTGLPLVVGSELVLDGGLRIVLLARDRESYGDLCQLVTRGRRSADKGSYRLTRDDVAALGARCLALWVPPDLLAANDEALGGEARFVAEAFGSRAWIAVELFARAGDAARLARLETLSRTSGLPLVAAGDVHMHVRARRALQDTLTAIRLGAPLAQCGYALFPNGERHLRSRGRLATIYPRALTDATLEVAQQCTFSLDELRYEYPREIVPEHETPASWLRKLTEQGLARRYSKAGSDSTSSKLGSDPTFLPRDAEPRDPVEKWGLTPISSPTLLAGDTTFRCTSAPSEVRELIEHELALIAELRYEPYFLTVHDIVAFARSQDILCQGRGSAANSAVCYCLGITAVDPARMSMLFERFISRERNEPPDIDVDFEHERREEVMQYVYEKYGRDRAALAATVITYRPKSAVRDVGKALGLGMAEVDRLSSGRVVGWPRDPARAHPRGGLRSGESRDPAAGEALGRAHGLPAAPLAARRRLRHRPRPLERLVPIENATMADRTVIQWDKDDLDALGLLKVDCLGARHAHGDPRASTCSKTAVRRGRLDDELTRGSGARKRGLTPISMQDIPSEDPAVYAHDPARRHGRRVPDREPRADVDAAAPQARELLRPGDRGRDRAARDRSRAAWCTRTCGGGSGEEPVDYPSEALRAVLERTLGVPLFQEQVMQLAVVAAGYTAGEADQLRRDMAAWRRKGGLEKFEERLIDGHGGSAATTKSSRARSTSRSTASASTASPSRTRRQLRAAGLRLVPGSSATTPRRSPPR